MFWCTRSLGFPFRQEQLTEFITLCAKSGAFSFIPGGTEEFFKIIWSFKNIWLLIWFRFWESKVLITKCQYGQQVYRKKNIEQASFWCYFLECGSCNRNSSCIDGKMNFPLPLFWNLDENWDLWHLPEYSWPSTGSLAEDLEKQKSVFCLWLSAML